MFEKQKYKHCCIKFFQAMKKGRGGVYIGDHTLLSSNVIGHQILTDVRHVPSIRKAWVVQPIEASIMALLSQIIKGGMICAEIGAGCGFYSLLLANLAGPSGKIYSFEPIPECYDILLKNRSLNELETMVCINRPVLNEIREIKQAYFDVNYQFFFSPPEGYIKREIVSKSTTLDLYLNEAGEISLDFLKIDDGIDIRTVWRGMAVTLAMNPEIKILCRINQTKHDPSDDLEKFLCEVERQHFSFYRLPKIEKIDKCQLLSRKIGQTILLSRYL